MSKKKLITVVVALSILIAVLATTLVLVIVAQSLQATSSITVSYRAEEVTCDVSSKYYVGSTGSGIDLVSSSDYTTTTLSFAPGVNSTGSLVTVIDDETNESEIIELDKTSASIVFEYKFVNKSSNVDILINLDTTEMIVNNMTVKYFATSTKQTDFTATSFTDSLVDKETFDSTENLLSATSTNDSTKYIYIVAKVDNLIDSATYEGNIAWSLTRPAETT